MATDERNFRSVYYEKVGFKSVEEKKSLEMLLKDRPLDRAKLMQFCLRFYVPYTYRGLVWKLTLGVVPIYVDSHPLVMNQRRQEFSDLHHALVTTRLINANLPKPQLFLAIWLLQSGVLPFDINLTQDKAFLSIVRSLIQMQFSENDADLYWTAKNFYEFTRKFHSDIPKLVEQTHNLLEKEDHRYYKSLVDNNFLDSLPLSLWFECCFAGVINEKHLSRVWDKVCGGSVKILVFIVVVMLTTLKHRILKFKDVESVLNCIRNMTEDTADIIVNKSVDMWQLFGSPLTVHDKSKT
ncbi:TBC1 domain family member 7 [Cylas formicarius]|uniref:TBC1 domain family member 7 n=1 Tax=Cylas formicarius TaxID=197179 RepID=UPI0029583A0C|nr:TBC1 domain family member 7 [Cylas formicarius]